MAFILYFMIGLILYFVLGYLSIFVLGYISDEHTVIDIKNSFVSVLILWHLALFTIIFGNICYWLNAPKILDAGAALRRKHGKR